MTDLGPLDKIFIYELKGSGYPGRFPARKGFLGIWPEPPFYYAFFMEESEQAVRSWVAQNEGWSLHSMENMEYSQWQQLSTGDQEVGPFLIRHVGDTAGTCAAGKLPIRVDPGIVFGSGVHPTTRSCLILLDVLMKEVKIERVLDFGTGTGILGVASRLLGAERVVCTDCNPVAAHLALRNLKLNEMQHGAYGVVADSPGAFSGDFDLLLANIEWPSLKALLTTGHDLSHFQWVILSGFLEGQWEEFASMLPSCWSVVRRENLEGWIAVLLKSSVPPREKHKTWANE